MNMPQFSGEALIYQTRGQYRTGRHGDALHVAARTISLIYPAVIDVGEETTLIHSCRRFGNDRRHVS
jgi:hypothetical protein